MKKTILFHVHNFLFGGIEKVLIELLKALDPNKYNIHLSIAHNLGDSEVLRKDLPAHVHVHHLIEAPILNWAKKKKLTGNINAAQKVIAELFLAPFGKAAATNSLKTLVEKADVVVDFDMTLAPYLPVINEKRTIAFCHFSLPFYWDGNRRKLDKLAGRLAQYDKVVMLCDEMKDEAAEMYPTLAPKLVRQYNALDFERMKSMSTDGLDGYETLEASGYVVSVGRLHAAQKDFSTVIKAYAQCRRDGAIDVPLVIVGEGSDKDNLQALAKSEGIGQQVVFTGRQENPYKWMAKAKAFLFASKYEGLPTVLIEALAMGCPVVATACPTGVREILMNGKCGTLVDVGDFKAMSEGLKLILQNESIRDKYAANAHQILEQFNIRNVLHTFEAILFPLPQTN